MERIIISMGIFVATYQVGDYFILNGNPDLLNISLAVMGASFIYAIWAAYRFGIDWGESDNDLKY